MNPFEIRIERLHQCQRLAQDIGKVPESPVDLALLLRLLREEGVSAPLNAHVFSVSDSNSLAWGTTRFRDACSCPRKIFEWWFLGRPCRAPAQMLGDASEALDRLPSYRTISQAMRMLAHSWVHWLLREHGADLDARVEEQMRMSKGMLALELAYALPPLPRAEPSLTLPTAPTCGDVIAALEARGVGQEYRIHLKKMWAWIRRNRGRIAAVPQRTDLWHRCRRLGTGQGEICPDDYTCAMVLLDMDPGTVERQVEAMVRAAGEAVSEVRMFKHLEDGRERAGAWVKVERQQRRYVEFARIWESHPVMSMDLLCARVSVWDAKLWEALACPSPFAGNQYTVRGTEAEEWIMEDAQKWLEAGGSCKLGLSPYTLITETGAVFHSACPWLYASPDGILVDRVNRDLIAGTLEMKFCGARRIHMRSDGTLEYPLVYAHQRVLQSAVMGVQPTVFHVDRAEPFFNPDPSIPKDHGVLSKGCNDVCRAGEYVVRPSTALPEHCGVTDARSTVPRSHLQLLLVQSAVNFVQKVCIAVQLGVFWDVFVIPDDKELPRDAAFVPSRTASGIASIDRARGIPLEPGWAKVTTSAQLSICATGTGQTDVRALCTVGEDGVSRAVKGEEIQTDAQASAMSTPDRAAAPKRPRASPE